MIVMSKKVDMDSCMTAAILLGSNTPENIELVDLATPDQLADASIACIECGGSGRVELNDWDHHHYDGDTTEKKYLPPACIQAAREKLGQIPSVVQAIGVWDEGKFAEFPEFREIQVVFNGMLLDVRNVAEQAKLGIQLCQKWLNGDFSLSQDEKKWKKVKSEYDIKIAEAMDAVEFIDTLSGRVVAYVESPFWGTLREIQNTIDSEDIVAVRNPANGKVTIALNPQGPGDLKFICELLNKLDPGWGGPITGKIIGSPQAGTKLEFNDIIDIVRLFM
jgi:hypothetical protein